MTSQAATTMRRLHANRPRTKRDDAPIAVEPIIGWMALRTTEKLQRTRIQTMATANGAKALGCYHLTGSLTRGKNADMLVINGDPLKNIYDIDVKNMDMIIKDGEEVLRYKD